MNEKYTIMSPFEITSKMLGPHLFSSTARESLGDKMEYYFQDHSFMPLFIQVWIPGLDDFLAADLRSCRKITSSLNLPSYGITMDRKRF